MGFFDIVKDVGSFFSPGGAAIGIGNAAGLDMGTLALDAVTGGAYSNTNAAMEINKQNIGFAQKQQDFQERMSNSAYQRAMADMDKAGLNPMLAYSQGGASVPQGTSPSLVTPEPGKMGAGIANTALTAASGVAALKNTASQTDLNRANLGVAAATEQKTMANARESMQNTTNTFVDTQKKTAEVREANARADQAEMERDVAKEAQGVKKRLAPVAPVMDRISQGLGIYGSAKGKSIYMGPSNPLPTDDGKPYNAQKDFRDSMKTMWRRK